MLRRGPAGPAASSWARVGEGDKLAAVMGEAATNWPGFSRWCWEVGHDSHQVLRLAPMGCGETDLSYGILREQIEYSERWAGELAGDPELVDNCQQLLAHAFWRMGR